MLTLYHYSLSVGSRFVRLLGEEMKIKIELVEEPVWQRRPHFLGVNPAGSVPVLIDNESPPIIGPLPIMEYLHETRASLHPGNSLMPDDALTRAEVRRLVDWVMVKFEAEVTRYLVHEKFIKREIRGGSPEASILRAARNNIKSHISYFGFLAESRNWLGGAKMSYADLAAAAALSVCDYLGEVNWDEDEHCKSWYARMKSRPSFRPLLAETLRGLPASPTYADLDF